MEVGIGLFLVLDPAAETFPPLKCVQIRDITYGSCLVLGSFSAAFKWVTPKVAFSPDFDADTECLGSCQELGYCLEIHCFCVKGRCQKYRPTNPQ